MHACIVSFNLLSRSLPLSISLSLHSHTISQLLLPRSPPHSLVCRGLKSNKARVQIGITTISFRLYAAVVGATPTRTLLFYLRIICKAEIVFVDASISVRRSVAENANFQNLISLFDFWAGECFANGLKTSHA